MTIVTAHGPVRAVRAPIRSYVASTVKLTFSANETEPRGGSGVSRGPQHYQGLLTLGI